MLQKLRRQIEITLRFIYAMYMVNIIMLYHRNQAKITTKSLK
jgi:hypothetical protein